MKDKPKNLQELIDSGEITVSIEEAIKVLQCANDFNRYYNNTHCAVCQVELQRGINYFPTRGDFYRVCQEHHEYHNVFDLDYALKEDSLPVPVKNYFYE